MKFLTILFMFFLSFFVQAQENTSTLEQKDWLSDYNSALETAKSNKRNILLYFTGSDWCPPCKMLKKDFFETSDFKVLSKSFVLLYIDIPRDRNSLTKEQLDHNMRLLPIYNKQGVFPVIKILNSEGKVLDELSGYRMNGNILPYLTLMKKYK
tara:strand:- start:2106 stop:2564 length:459 start_codon:yes stop_codon:yes gene_type:complete